MSEAVTKELPKNWEWSTLGNVCEKPQYGWTTKASQEGDLHLLRTTDITSGQINWDTVPYCVEEPEDKEKYLIKDGDIVVSRAGSVGVSYLISNPEPSVFASYLIRFKPLIDRKYVFYFLKSPAYWNAISEKSAGIALQNVNASKLKEIHIPVAPPEQQKRIVAKIEELFSHIDAGIEALKKAKQLLKQYRQSVLKAAVTGELTKEWREANKDKLEPASQLLERILKERSQRWEEQQIEQFKAKGKMPKDDKWKEKYKDAIEPSGFYVGELPKEWSIASLDQACELFVDSPHRTPKYSDKGLPALRPRDVVNGILKLETAAVVSNEEFEIQTQRHVPNQGDIVYSRELSFGWGIIVPADTKVCLSQGMCVFRPHLNVSSEYFISVINGPLGRMQAESIAVGAAHPHLNLGDIKGYCVPIPPSLEQEEIVKIVEEKLSSIEHLDHELDRQLLKAEKNKQSILASAFSGKITNG